MLKLITASLESDDSTWLAKFPRELISEAEAKMIDFALKYKTKYGTMPEVDRMKKACPNYVALGVGSKTPLQDLYDQTIESKTIFALRRQLNLALIELDDGKIPDALLRDGLKLVAQGGDIDNLESYDRDRYFRSKRIYTGLVDIDNATGGISAGEVMVLSGRLGTGKSTVSHFIAYNWWKAGLKVLYVSAEMVTADIFARIDGFIGGFNPKIFRTKDSGSAEVKRALEQLDKGMLQPHGSIIVPSLRSKTPSAIFSLAQDLNVDAVIIDGFYLMDSDEKNKSSANWERVKAVSNQIKQQAIATEIPCIAITQIKRGAEKTIQGTYDTEGLAYSDASGQDADFVVALMPDELEKEVVDVQLIKNRFGRETTQMIRIDFDNMAITDSKSSPVVSPKVSPSGAVMKW